MRGEILLVACCMCVIFVISCAPSAKPGPLVTRDWKAELATKVNRSSELKVLFIGNSYTFGVPANFSQIAAARGKNVSVAQCTHNGWTLAMHASSRETRETLQGEDWDVVVIQEQSLVPSWSKRRVAAKMLPPLRMLVVEAQKKGAVPVLYQTWGRRGGDDQLKGDDFYAMSERLRAGYALAAADSGGLPIADVGGVWEREVSTGRTGDLFQPDGSHPTREGTRLAAEVIYQTIFSQ